MRVGRIALMAMVAFVSREALGQQRVGTNLTILVTDRSGAPIPNAQVEIMSQVDGRLLAFTADGKGVAKVGLEPGEYQYRVASQAFCPKNGNVSIYSIWTKEINAKLEVVSCPGPCSPPCVIVLGEKVPKGYPVEIKVTDMSGAAVPGALVEIDSSSSSFQTAKSNEKGQVVVVLPTGRHSIAVGAAGFLRWRGFAEVQATIETITAKLRVAGMDNPGVSIEPASVDIPLYMPQLKAIDFQPLDEPPSAPAKHPSVLQITVQDTSGAVIPNALVQVRLGDRNIAELRANSAGEARLPVDPGSYTVVVSAVSFRSFSQIVDLASDEDRSIRAVLKIGDIGSGPVVDDTRVLEPDRTVPDDLSIASIPLATIPVPAYKLRHSFFHHRAM